MILASCAVSPSVCASGPPGSAGSTTAWTCTTSARATPGAPPSAEIAAAAAGVGDDRVDVAELDAPFSHQEPMLVRALGLDPDATRISPSGGSLCGHVMMASGLIRSR